MAFASHKHTSGHMQQSELELGEKIRNSAAVDTYFLPPGGDSVRALVMHFIDVHLACRRGDLKSVKRYLKLWGDIEKQDLVSYSALLVASLIFQEGNTPLLIAYESGLNEIVSLLIEKGASLDHQNMVRLILISDTLIIYLSMDIHVYILDTVILKLSRCLSRTELP
jgi:hypothetical protein